MHLHRLRSPHVSHRSLRPGSTHLTVPPTLVFSELQGWILGSLADNKTPTFDLKTADPGCGNLYARLAACEHAHKMSERVLPVLKVAQASKQCKISPNKILLNVLCTLALLGQSIALEARVNVAMARPPVRRTKGRQAEVSNDSQGYNG